MIRFISLPATILFVVCTALLPSSAGTKPFRLASGGKTAFTITVPDDAIPAEKTAARELQEHLKQMTGADFTVVSASDFGGGPRIAVGFQKGLPVGLAETKHQHLGSEELVIDSEGDTLLLAGGRPRGALYATYEFLESLGVRWYTPKETLIPSRPELSLVVKSERYTSPFRSRTNVPGNGQTAEWYARNRMNSMLVWNNPGEEYGGGVRQGPDMHTLWRLMSPDIFKTHPEWAAMVDGKRQINHANNHWGVCLTNSQLQDFIVARTMDWLRKTPGVTDVWFGQNDGSPFCTCKTCQTFYDEHGGAPSSIICFVLNKLADVVAAEFPNVRVKTLAYSWSLTPPTNITLRDNVIVMLCASFNWFSELGKDEDTMTFISDVAEWKKVGSEFEAYLYSHPTDDFWFPAACLYNQARNIRHINELGIKSIHQEIFGSKFGGEFVHLFAWVNTRMMWRPDSDVESLVQDFCRGYYGEAAEDVLYAIHRTEQNHASGWLPSKNNVEYVPGYLEQDVVEDVLPRLMKAYESQRNATLKCRLGFVLLPYLWGDYWMNFHGPGRIDDKTDLWGVDFTNRERCGEEGALIRQLMIENGVSNLRLNGAFDVHRFQLGEMTKAYPYARLKEGDSEVIVVPALLGKMVKFARNGHDILKSIWGYQLYQYPIEGYGRDEFAGIVPNTFALVSNDGRTAKLAASTANGLAEKTFDLRDGTLSVKLHFVARNPVKGALSTAPRLNMSPEVFGIYPKLFVGKGGSWSLVELGKAGTMWYQAAAIPIEDFNGTMLLVSENGQLALEIQIPPKQLGSTSYLYDRYDFQPKGTGRLLELKFITPERAFTQGNTQALEVTYRILFGKEIPDLK